MTLPAVIRATWLLTAAIAVFTGALLGVSSACTRSSPLMLAGLGAVFGILMPALAVLITWSARRNDD